MDAKQTEILGSTAQACPYCGVVLERMPKRKTRCRDCGQYIFVRTRPQDRQKVLLRESELAELERQWVEDAEKKPHIRPRPVEVREKVVEALTQQFGRAPSDSDVLWRIFNEERLQYSSSESWGLYTQVNFEMGELLMSEGKPEAALAQYINAYILISNGPMNIDRELVQSGYARFSGEGPPAPNYVKRIDQMLKQSALPNEKFKDLFFSSAQLLQRDLQLPLSPEASWDQLPKSLKWTD
jgi:DNA-directed RNA polymerase subunit RPC12/RpoP